MNIKPISNESDLQESFSQLEKVFQAKMGTKEADDMEILVTLIEAYENKHCCITNIYNIELFVSYNRYMYM
jgi:HTH-type transcriptional regulator/antitoxin HigA